MPLQFVDPELFLSHLGINIYHTYRQDNFNDPQEHWFTTDIQGDSDENPNCDFDVRDLKVPYNITLGLEAKKQRIKYAIEHKMLTLPADMEDYTHISYDPSTDKGIDEGIPC